MTKNGAMLSFVTGLLILLVVSANAAEAKKLSPAFVIKAKTESTAMPDRRYVFGREDGRIFVWHAASGQLIASGNGKGGTLDTRTGIAVLGNEMWDLGAKKPVVTAVKAGPYALGIEHVGRSATIDGSNVLVWDIAGKKRLGRVEGIAKSPSFLALSESGEYLAVGRDAVFDIIEVKTGRQVKTGSLAAVWPYRIDPYKGFSDFPDDREVDFTVVYERESTPENTPDKPLWRTDWEIKPVNIFSAHVPDTGLRARLRGNVVDIVWAVEGSTQAVLIGHDAPVRKAAFSPDRWTIATGDKTGNVKIWDARSGELLSICQGGTEEIISLSYSPDAQFLLASSSSEIRIYAVSP